MVPNNGFQRRSNLPQKDVLSQSLHADSHFERHIKADCLSKSLHSVPRSGSDKVNDTLSMSLHSEPGGGNSTRRPRRRGSLFKPVNEDASATLQNEEGHKVLDDDAECEAEQPVNSVRPFSDIEPISKKSSSSYHDKMLKSISEAVSIVNSTPSAASHEEYVSMESSMKCSAENHITKDHIVASPINRFSSGDSMTVNTGYGNESSAKKKPLRSTSDDQLSALLLPKIGAPSPSGFNILRRGSRMGSSDTRLGHESSENLQGHRSPHLMIDGRGASDSPHKIDLTSLSSEGDGFYKKKQGMENRGGDVPVDINTLQQMALAVAEIQRSLDQQQAVLQSQQQAISTLQTTLLDLIASRKPN